MALIQELEEFDVDFEACLFEGASVDIENVGDVAPFVLAGLEDHAHELVSIFAGDGSFLWSKIKLIFLAKASALFQVPFQVSDGFFVAHSRFHDNGDSTIEVGSQMARAGFPIRAAFCGYRALS